MPNRRTGQQRGNRKGEVFPLRISEHDRVQLEAAHAASEGPRAFGPWLLWAARIGALMGVSFSKPQIGSCLLPPLTRAPGEPRSSHDPLHVLPQFKNREHPGERPVRIILDLCGGSGAWSEPYWQAGYAVHIITLPELDVRTYEPPPNVHGILAAPPCDQFSVARNGTSKPRDFAAGLECVVACLRIIALARPKWWAIENPGRSMLARWLGPVTDSWEPYEFGDPWSKRTALWGDFEPPTRGPYVEPTGSAMDRRTAAARAVTPPGFARAFFEANP